MMMRHDVDYAGLHAHSPSHLGEPRDRTSHGQKLYQNFSYSFSDLVLMNFEVTLHVMEKTLDGYISG
jgi:hypothetical protein